MTKDELAVKMINKYNYRTQFDIVIEEMAELTQAILKLRRNENFSNLVNVLEEYVDVNIALANIKIVLGNHFKNLDKELSKTEKEKIERTIKRCLQD